jgi:uncharacterized protein (TIGR00251 family)
MKLHVKVKPGASKDLIEKESDDLLKVRIQAPPVDGRANVYLIAFLAKQFKVPKSALELTKGTSSPFKTIEVEDVYSDKINAFINGLASTDAN